MVTVAISAAGGGIGAGAIEALRRDTDYRLVGLEMEAKAGGLYLADEGYAVPAADDEDWVDEVANVFEIEDVDAAIFLIDAELTRLPDLREIVDGVAFLTARQEVVDFCYDKLDMTRAFEERGLLVPTTVSGADVDSYPTNAYPAVVKPRTGQGNYLRHGVDLVESAAEVESVVAARDEDADDLVVQKFVEGTEYTTEVLGTRDDELLAVVPKEAVSSDPYHRVTRDAPEVTAACEAIFAALSPRGVVNVQHIVDADGDAYAIEVNPRFSASSCLTARAGVNGYELLVRDAMGEGVSPPDGYERGLHVLRYPKSVCVPDADLEGENA